MDPLTSSSSSTEKVGAGVGSDVASVKDTIKTFPPTGIERGIGLILLLPVLLREEPPAPTWVKTERVQVDRQRRLFLQSLGHRLLQLHRRFRKPAGKLRALRAALD